MKFTIHTLALLMGLLLASGAFAERTIDKSTPKLYEGTAKELDKSSPRRQEATTKELDKSTPKLMERSTSPERPKRAARALKARDFQRLSTQHHRSGKPIPGEPATNLKAPNQPPPKYEIEDCGNGLVCCSYSGANSTCNLFMYLCSSQGGQATGDKNEAVCKF